jgi:membrane protease YdiL (CAAX protease family)
VLLSVAKVLIPSLNVEQQQQLGFQPTTSHIGLILTFISLVVLPPLVEEFIMRGFLFTSLLRRLKVVPSIVITSIIFASAHLQFGSDAPLLWVAAIDTFMLSLVLCYMRYKTGSLWPGIFLHALKNCVAFLSIFIFHLT